MKPFALIVSLFMHPLLMVTYGCLLLFFGIHGTIYDYMTPTENKWSITLVVFVFTFVFPVLNIFFLFKLKRVSSLTLSRQADRTYPYILTALFYFGLLYLLMDSNIWLVIKRFIACAGTAILFSAFINLRFKISAHMVGLGGLLGMLIAISYTLQFDLTYYYIAVILLAGLTAASRLALGEHKPYQLYLGFLLGLIIQAGLFFVLQSITFA